MIIFSLHVLANIWQYCRHVIRFLLSSYLLISCHRSPVSEALTSLLCLQIGSAKHDFVSKASPSKGIATLFILYSRSIRLIRIWVIFRKFSRDTWTVQWTVFIRLHIPMIPAWTASSLFDGVWPLLQYARLRTASLLSRCKAQSSENTGNYIAHNMSPSMNLIWAYYEHIYFKSTKFRSLTCGANAVICSARGDMESGRARRATKTMSGLQGVGSLTKRPARPMNFCQPKLSTIALIFGEMRLWMWTKNCDSPNCREALGVCELSLNWRIWNSRVVCDRTMHSRWTLSEFVLHPLHASNPVDSPSVSGPLNTVR